MDFEKLLADGWVHLPSFIPDEKLEIVEKKVKVIFGVENFDSLSEKIIELNKSNQKKLYQYNLCINEITEIHGLLLDVDSLLAQHYSGFSGVGIDRYVLLGIPADKRLAYSWHQESSYIPTVERLYNMWIPLFNPSVQENGAMSVLTGSHKLGNVGYERIDRPGGYCDLVVDTKPIISKYPEHYCCIAPGDGILFDKNLLHRSNFNGTEKVRFSLVIRIGYIDGDAQLSDWKKDY